MRQQSLLIVSVPALLIAIAACSASIGAPAGGTDAPSIAESKKSRAPASASVAPAVTANNAFAIDLYSHLRASPDVTGNLLTSPISASIALTMTYAGAHGATATQMASALHFGSATTSIFDSQNSLTQALAGRAAAALAIDQAADDEDDPPSADDYQLQIVNSVWGDQSYTWQPTFLDQLAQSYGTGVYLADFKNAWEPARQMINGWVSGQTSDEINNLLPTQSLDASTRMVLVNAIHMKLPWASAFSVDATAPSPFTRSDGTTVSAPFMNEEASLAYVDDGAAQIVALPLSGGQLSVVIALPHGDLATYEAGLTATSAAIVQPATQTLVQLSLPKVAFTSPTFSLKDELQAMGMKDAFDLDAADFSGLCAQPADGQQLYVSDVLQKATIAMAEGGVEAAAATAVVIDADAGVVEPPPHETPMVVNRPFLMAIVDIPTGAVLFLGHIEDPTAAGSP